MKPCRGTSTQPRHATRPHPHLRRLGIELLEDRRLLSATTEDQAIELFSTSPALFVENQGQWEDASVRFLHQGDGVNVAMTDTGPVFQLFQRETEERDGGLFPSKTLEAGTRAAGKSVPFPFDPLDKPQDALTRMTQFSVRFDGANVVEPVGSDRAETRFNYFIGDQANWHADVPGYEAVAYERLYDGIDLHTWGKRSHLKYEFHVAPGADYRQIEVSYEGIEGVWLDVEGALHVETTLGELVDDAPYVYQQIDGRQVDVAGRFELIDADTYSFRVSGPYDPTVELVVDPNLAWGSFLGGYSRDRGYGIAVDAAGNAFITGTTLSSDFPTPGGFDTSYAGYPFDAFVAKVTSSGRLAWATFLGGSESEHRPDIAADLAGNAVVTGSTSSPDFPTLGGFDQTYNGRGDAFVAKLTSSGHMAWASFLGGSVQENGYDIAVDAPGNAVVTGWTSSYDFPTPGGFDTSLATSDAFVAKVSPSGQLVWASFLGGSGSDGGWGVATDSAGNVLITGQTSSADFPTPDGFDSSLNGGPHGDAFVAKVTSSGQFNWGSFLGGGNDDWGFGIGADAAGNAVVTGRTYSPDFPTPSGFDSTLDGVADAFVTKLSGSGQLLWGTFLGGSNTDYARGIALDAAGNAAVTGTTYSPDFPSLGGFDTSLDGLGGDAFVASITKSGRLAWATYLGGWRNESGEGVAVDTAGNALITGWTTSSDFPTPGGFDTVYDGRPSGFCEDAFVAKIGNIGQVYPDFYFFSQRDPDWKDDQIRDATGRAWGTIGNETVDVDGDGIPDPIGCAMTSTAMLLKYYGKGTDPGGLNAWLNANGGYALGGLLYWYKPAQYSGGRMEYMDALSWTSLDPATDNDRWEKLTEEVERNHPVIVQVDSNLNTPAVEGHWVLVTRFLGGDATDPANYTMNDPWDLPEDYDPQNPPRLSRYQGGGPNENTFFATRVYHPLLAGNLTDLAISQSDIMLLPLESQQEVVATVRNESSVGVSTVSVRIRDVDTGVVLGTEMMGWIDPHASADVSVLWTPAGPGSRIEVMVDPFDEIEEVSNLNNTAIAVYGEPGAPLIHTVRAHWDGNTDPSVFGRYVSGVSLWNTFTATTVGGTDVDHVEFTLGALGTKSDSHGDNGWRADFDMGQLSADTPLTAVAYDAEGHASDPWTGTVHVVPFPSWLGTPDEDDYFGNAEYHLSGLLAEGFERSHAIPDDWGIIDGKTSEFRLGVRLGLAARLDTAHDVAIEHVFPFEATILDQAVVGYGGDSFLFNGSAGLQFPIGDDLRQGSVVVAGGEFGEARYDQSGGGPYGHLGTDFRGGLGTPVYAVADGVVTRAKPRGEVLDVVIIKHPKEKTKLDKDYYSAYLHLQGLRVQKNDKVARGQQIGEVGNYAGGPHLHFEIRSGGNDETTGEQVGPWGYDTVFNRFEQPTVSPSGYSFSWHDPQPFLLSNLFPEEGVTFSFAGHAECDDLSLSVLNARLNVSNWNPFRDGGYSVPKLSGAAFAPGDLVPVPVPITLGMDLDMALNAELKLGLNVADGTIEVLRGTYVEPSVSAQSDVFGGLGIEKFNLALEAGGELDLHYRWEYSTANGYSDQSWGTFGLTFRLVETAGLRRRSEPWTVPEDGPWTFGNVPPRGMMVIAVLAGKVEPDVLAWPNVTADDAGGVLLTRVVDADTVAGQVDPEIAYAVRDSAGTWSALSPVASNDLIESDPDAAFNGQGGVVVAWVANTIDPELVPTTDWEVYLQTQEIHSSYWDGVSWSTPQALTSDAQMDGRPEVAFRDGHGLMLWEHAGGTGTYDFDGFEVYYAVWDDATHAWGSPVRLTDEEEGHWAPTVAFGPSGEAMAVWVHDADGDPITAALHYATWDGASWTAPGAVPLSSNEGVREPRIGYTSTGDVLLAWVGNEGGADILYTSMWDHVAQSWSSPEAVPETPGMIEGLDLDVSAADEAMLVWHGWDGQNDLFSTARNLATSDPWAPPIRITDNPDGEWMASTVFDSAGKAVTVWANDNATTVFGEGADGIELKPAPNLAAEGIELLAMAYVEGQEAQLAVDVANVGLAASAESTVMFYYCDPDAMCMPIGDPVTVPALAPGESAYLVSDVLILPSGTNDYHADVASLPEETITDDNSVYVAIKSAPPDETGPQVSVDVPENGIVPVGTSVLTLSLDEPVVRLTETHISLVEDTWGIRPPEHVYLGGDRTRATLIFEGGLAEGSYRLKVLDSVTDLVGNVLDGDADGSPGGDYVRQFVIAPAVVGRYVFYNNSEFDGEDLAANQRDDGAIPPDKVALLPGKTATFVNYTSFSRGINGIMVDIAGLAGTPTVDDFEFSAGNDDHPEGWSAVTATPTIAVREDAGVDGSDRVTIIWPDNVIQKQWLEVTVLATENIGLSEADVFYFGNAIGESGNSTTDAKVNAYDMLGARDNQRTFVNPATIDFAYDYNRDARVNAYDMLIARDNQTHFLNALKLITVPDDKGPDFPKPLAAENDPGMSIAKPRNSDREARIKRAFSVDAVLGQTANRDSQRPGVSLAKLDWLYEFEPRGADQRGSSKDSPVSTAVDKLLTTSCA